jgi:hypothetical protein
MATKQFDVFISYSSQNRTKAFELVKRIEAKGYSCFFDKRDIQMSDAYSQTISDTIPKCSCVVLLLTENSNQSKHVLNELDIAFNSEIPIFPLKIDSTEGDKLSYYLRTTQWLDVLESSIEEIADVIVAKLEDRLVQIAVAGEKSKSTISVKNGAVLLFSCFLLYFTATYFWPNSTPGPFPVVEKEDIIVSGQFIEIGNQHMIMITINPTDTAARQTLQNTTYQISTNGSASEKLDTRYGTSVTSKYFDQPFVEIELTAIQPDGSILGPFKYNLGQKIENGSKKEIKTTPFQPVSTNITTNKLFSLKLPALKDLTTNELELLIEPYSDKPMKLFLLSSDGKKHDANDISLIKTSYSLDEDNFTYPKNLQEEPVKTIVQSKQKSGTISVQLSDILGKEKYVFELPFKVTKSKSHWLNKSGIDLAKSLCPTNFTNAKEYIRDINEVKTLYWGRGEKSNWHSKVLTDKERESGVIPSPRLIPLGDKPFFMAVELIDGSMSKSASCLQNNGSSPDLILRFEATSKVSVGFPKYIEAIVSSRLISTPSWAALFPVIENTAFINISENGNSPVGQEISNNYKTASFSGKLGGKVVITATYLTSEGDSQSYQATYSSDNKHFENIKTNYFAKLKIYCQLTNQDKEVVCVVSSPYSRVGHNFLWKKQANDVVTKVSFGCSKESFEYKKTFINDDNPYTNSDPLVFKLPKVCPAIFASFEFTDSSKSKTAFTVPVKAPSFGKIKY